MKKNFFYFLIAVVIAFGLWAYVVTTVSPESEATFHNISVAWEAGSDDILKDKGYMVLSDSMPTITLRLRGNRSDLDKLKNSDITVIADLAKINHTGEQILDYDVYFTGGGAFEILNQNPNGLTLQIVEWASKDVPVVVNYTGTLGLEYIAFKEDLILNRTTVKIEGPKSVVDQVSQAVINVDLTDQTETISMNDRVTLCNSKGEPVDVKNVTVPESDVRLTLRILRVKEIMLNVIPNYGGGVTSENSTLTQNYTSIKVAGSEKILSALPDVLELGTINLAEITENTTVTLPITDGMLQGAENLSGITEVEVAVTVPERITRRLEITDMTQIRVNGLPEGMTLEFVTQKVAVTLIGRADQVNEITAEDLTITVNAADVEVNDYQSLSAEVQLSDRYPDVQATVNHAITVNISAAEVPGGQS